MINIANAENGFGAKGKGRRASLNLPEIDDETMLTFHFPDGEYLVMKKKGSKWVEDRTSSKSSPDTYGSKSYGTYLDLTHIIDYIMKDYSELGYPVSVEAGYSSSGTGGGAKGAASKYRG